MVKNRVAKILVGIVLLLCSHVSLSAPVQGIYISRNTLLHPRVFKLAKQAKEAGINHIVVDYTRTTSRYTKRIQYLKHQGFAVVLRIVVFPGGARPHQIQSRRFMQKFYNRLRRAVKLSVDGIQLDYIRYHDKHTWSKKNVHDIHAVVKQAKNIAHAHHVSLEVDVFGVVAHGPSYSIGQYAPVLAQDVDAICPMVYPSHYTPYDHHTKYPYQTVFNSMVALHKQLVPFPHVKTIAFIEATNFRKRLSFVQRQRYVAAEIEAAEDAHADGWYVWSANNHYSHLFQLLKNRQH